MSSEAEFYLSAFGRVKRFECIKIAHPNFTQSYYIVRNKPGGLTATVEGAPTVFGYYPLRITAQAQDNDLDYSLQVDLGDVGDIMPMELDAVAAADGFGTLPTLDYWAFRSDDLLTPLLGPIRLEVQDLPVSRDGTSFIAAAPYLNVNRTGELYITSRFPMMRAYL